jgi:bifunctional DNA-binding transcriptional regulator/antitoxin component of YhaV-PrlF toxin-antitoxin module
VIPKAIREERKLVPGQELFLYVLEGKLPVNIIHPITDLRGIAKGLDRKKDDRDRNDRF